MANINFVPDDYVQGNESRRANLMCVVLFAIVMAGLGGSFVTIKIRQKACEAKESLVSDRMAKMQESIQRFEQLQTKRKEMMRTALTTAELLEPVPRTVLLASLTNNLPPGVSLMKLQMIQKEPPKQLPTAGAATTKYQAAQAGKPTPADRALPAEAKLPLEKLLETHLDITGIAPTDLQVASYIERLSISSLFTNVALVESKEHKVETTTFREFKLQAMVRPDIQLSKEDIDGIKSKAERSVYHF